MFHYVCYAEYTIKGLLESGPAFFYLPSEDTGPHLGCASDCLLSPNAAKNQLRESSQACGFNPDAVIRRKNECNEKSTQYQTLMPRENLSGIVGLLWTEYKVVFFQ